MAIRGFNFRESQAYVTDPSDTTYVLATDVYPVTRNGVTFGRNGFTFVHRNRSLSNDPRLAGIAQAPNNDASNTFNWRFDLPETGTYNISLAAGDASFAKNNYVRIYDDQTLVATIASGVATSANQFVDAAGVVLGASDWPSQNSKLEIQFSSTICNLRVGANDTGASGDSAVAHFAFEQLAGPSLTITDPIVPGTTTTIASNGNIDPWTSARITDASGNVKEITLASQTSVSAPALGTQDYCQFGTVTLEVYNDTESATTSATFDPPAAYEFLVTLPATPSNLTNTGYLFNWSPDNGYEDVQVISPFEIDTNGNIVLAPSDGVYTLYSIDDFDGEMQGFTVTIQDGEVVSVGRFTRRNLTRRTFTRRSLTARP